MPELDRRREREKKKRRRRSDSFDEDDEGAGLSTWKIGIIFGVIIVCFAMLYPTVFHPFVMGFFGSKDQKPAAQNRPPAHPAMGGAGAMPRHGAGRGGEHPAMRMAAAQADAQGGGGKGMFTWMLPIYTIGVVIFLLYTLFKGKKGKKNKRRNRYDSEESSEEEDSHSKFSGKGGRKRLKELQSRLAQTEDAMSKILEQIQQAQANGELPDIMEPSTSGADPADPLMEISEDSKKVMMGDLEGALQDFKILSDAYEVEKNRHLKEESSESEERTQTESEEEEDDTQSRRKMKGNTQAKKKYRKKKSESEESDNLSQEEDDEEVEEIAIPEKVVKPATPEIPVKESVIPVKKSKEKDAKTRKRSKRAD